MFLYENDIQRLNEIRNYILTNLASPLSLADIVCRYGLSNTTLKRHFRFHFGATVHQFIKQSRMKKAYELLTNGKPIAETAAAVGYTNADAFSRAFKLEFGKGPLQLLKEHF